MKRNKTLDIILMVLAVITAIAMTICTVRFADGAKTLIVVPLYISTVIFFLQSRVSRFAFLIGAINALLYTAVYIYDGIYLTAAYALFFSCPIQVLTFIRWKKKDNDGDTVFLEMSWKMRLAVIAGFLACFGVFYALLRYIGSDYSVYDTLTMLFGILITILTAAPYVEYVPLGLASQIVSLLMFMKMARTEPIQNTYLIFQVYCMICVTVAAVRIFRIFMKQKKSV